MSYMPCTSGDEIGRRSPRPRARAASARGRRRAAAGIARSPVRGYRTDWRRHDLVRPGGGRRRPAGGRRACAASTPGDARASQSVVRRSARTRPARALPSSTGPSTVTAALGAQRVARGRDRLGRAAELGQPAERREAERPAPGALGVGDERSGRRDAPPRTTSCSGSRVWSSSTPPRRPAGRAGGRPHEQPQRLLGGTGPRREQLLVELEEGDQADRRVAAGTRWSTASVPMSTGDVGHVVGRGVDRADLGRGSSAARSSRTRVTPGRTARKRGAVAVQADGGPHGVAAPCAREARVVARRTVAPHRSQRASSLHVRQASSRARPLRFSTHTARAPRVDARGGARRRARRVSSAVAGFLVARVDDLDAGPRHARCPRPAPRRARPPRRRSARA